VVEFLQFTLSGIVFGMVYAAVALSLVLIWRGTRLLNFAQGGMAMFTTYVAIEVIYKTHSYWAGFVIALAAGLVVIGDHRLSQREARIGEGDIDDLAAAGVTAGQQRRQDALYGEHAGEHEEDVAPAEPIAKHAAGGLAE